MNIEPIIRIVGIFLFVVIVVVAIICPSDKLLEFLFIWHEKALIISGIIFVGVELYYLISELVEKVVNKYSIDVKELVIHLLWGICFLFLVFADLYIFNKFGGPKLVKVEILYPSNDAKVPLYTDVEVSVRKVEDQFVYILVTTPQGTMWVQEKLFTNQFKDKLKGRAQLGEGEVGVGETFKIFAIATKEELMIGVLPALPSKYTPSVIVEVKKNRGVSLESTIGLPVSTKETVWLTEPAEGSRICWRDMVRGTVSNPGLQVFVLIHPMATNRFWVEPLPERGERWHTYCYFGEPGKGIGEPFEIVAVASANRSLLKEGDTLASPLPDNPQVVARSSPVIVIRDPCLQRSEPPPPPPSKDEMTVKIYSPSDGDLVPHRNIVKGIFSNVPDDYKIWVVVYPYSAARYYPQSPHARKNPEETWQATAYLGPGPDLNIGVKFDIYVIITDKEGSKKIEDYLNESAKKGDFPGLDKLPAETKIKNKITVTRIEG